MNPQSPNSDSSHSGSGQIYLVSLLLVALAGGALVACKKPSGTGQEKKEASDDAKAFKEMSTTLKMQRQEFVRSLDEGKLPDTDAAFNQIRGQIEKSSVDGDDSEKAVATVASGYLEVVQKLGNEHKAALQRLMDADVFSFQVNSRETITAHKELLQQFIQTNVNLAATVTGRENAMQAGMQAAQLPSEKIAQITAVIKKAGGRISETQIKIRRCDHALAEGALKVLDLLDNNWGELRHDQATGKIVVDNNALRKEIGEQILAIRKVGENQMAMQKELLGSPEQSAKAQ